MSTRKTTTKKTAVKKTVAKKAAAKKAAAKKPAVKKTAAKPAAASAGASKRIDAQIKALPDWRGETLARLRALILSVDPAIVEEVKWGDVPVWSRDGIITTGETYKAAVKLTFAKGASLPDPAKMFNSSLDGNTRRAIDFREGDPIDAAALKALVRAAIAKNASR